MRSPGIRVLRVAQNRLTKIPLVLGLLLEGRLQKLDLRMNPQQAVRHSILERGCADQLSYLKGRLTREEAAEAEGRLQTLRASLLAEGTLPTSDATQSQHSPSAAAAATADGGAAEAAADRRQEEPQQPIAPSSSHGGDEPNSLKLIEEYKGTIGAIQREIDTNFSLSQAKRYALKKEMAMVRSRMIKEERKLGLRK